MTDIDGKEIVVGSEVYLIPDQVILDVTWVGTTILTGDDGETEYQGVDPQECRLIQ